METGVRGVTSDGVVGVATGGLGLDDLLLLSIKLLEDGVILASVAQILETCLHVLRRRVFVARGDCTWHFQRRYCNLVISNDFITCRYTCLRLYLKRKYQMLILILHFLSLVFFATNY